MEFWDAYDIRGNKTGKTLVRGEPIPQGLYHMICCVVIRHTDGDFLLMHRSPEKEFYPDIWEIGAAGCALQGESAQTCALREVAEETGLSKGVLEPMNRYVEEYTQTIYEGFLFTTDMEKSAVTMQQGETCGYRWLSLLEFLEFFDSDACIPRFKLRLRGYVNTLRNE